MLADALAMLHNYHSEEWRASGLGATMSGLVDQYLDQDIEAHISPEAKQFIHDLANRFMNKGVGVIEAHTRAMSMFGHQSPREYNLMR